MQWLTDFLTSSVGKKLVMSLTGLFLCSFLLIHLLGNLSLLSDDNGETFNTYAYFMTTNPLIKFISIGLYAGILLHAIQGLLLYFKNKSSKGKANSVKTYANGSWISKNMALLGTLILAFLFIHMGDFWFKMKFTDELASISYNGAEQQVKDLYKRVHVAFSETWIVVVYMIGLIALALHLLHGFGSAFRTLGMTHKKYTPIIQAFGVLFSILVPLGFAIIPLYIYFN